MAKVQKRDGQIVPFDKSKISNAILKAMKNGSGIVKEHIAESIATEIEDSYKETDEVVRIEDIEQQVFNKLIAKKQKLTARAYEGYRSVREFQREHNTIDKSIEGLFDGTNQATLSENSNKNEYLISTVRDLIAEEVSKDYAKRKMLTPDVVTGINDGTIYCHDMGYYISKEPNCCLVNLRDMLDNGTCINGKLIESPHKFTTACTIATQIVAQVASGQFGGQTITLTHLSPYLRKSKVKIEKSLREQLDGLVSEEVIQRLILDRLKEELTAGVQTFNYQVNTLQSSNGTNYLKSN